MLNRVVLVLLLTAGSVVTSTRADVQQAGPARLKVVHAGRLFDGTSAVIRERVSILVDGERIVDVQNGFLRPAGAEVIDLSRAFVMPGLIDCHTHITGEGTADAIVRAVTQGAVDAAVRSTAYAKRTLEAGFTSIRDVGSEGGADVALKRAINDGLVPGPRIWTARHTLSITGGHGDQGGLRHDLSRPPTFEDGVVDSAQEAAKAVRYQHKYGADLIKFTATGGVLSINASADLQQFTDDEMKTIVDTAHMLGIKVAAHAHGKRGMEAAIRSGVDSIEHGTYADADTHALFKKHGTYLVPTIIAGKTVAEMAKRPGALHPSVREKAAKVGPLMQAAFGRAWRSGVKIAFGTDSGVSVHGENAREFAYMAEAGMPVVEALLTATRNAADLLGASDRVGSIQKGRFADVIAVDGDPLRNAAELERVTFVMKGGIVHKESARGVPSGTGRE